MKHWIYFLPDGPGVRYLRLLTQRREDIHGDLDRAIAEVNRLKAELSLEEDRITQSILEEWSQDEIIEARAKAKIQTPDS